MSTPVSNSTPYCSGTQFCVLYDWRLFANLLSDTDDSLASSSSVATATTPFLAAASGKVEMACFVGGRYTPADLAALTGNMLARLQKLVADIAAEEIYRHRGNQGINPLPQFAEADETLEALAKGWIIFGLQETIDAGVLDQEEDTAQDVANRRLVSFTADRLFGRRNNRLGN